MGANSISLEKQPSAPPTFHELILSGHRFSSSIFSRKLSDVVKNTGILNLFWLAFSFALLCRASLATPRFDCLEEIVVLSDQTGRAGSPLRQRHGYRRPDCARSFPALNPAGAAQLLTEFSHATVTIEASTHCPWISRYLTEHEATVLVAT